MSGQSTESFVSLAPQAETITRGLALLAGLAYGAGLIITNVYLADHGFFLFQLAKADYIFVGSLWLALLVLAFIWEGAALDIWRDNEQGRLLGRMASAAILLLGFLILVAMLSVFSVDPITGLDELHLLYTTGVFAGQAICLHLGIWISNRWRKGNEYRAKGVYGLLAIASLVLVTVFLSAFYRYALDIFPLYPRIIGGGRPATAALILREESRNPARASGLSVDEDGKSQDVMMIYETSDSYFFLIRGEEETAAIRLSADDVSSVIYR